MDVDIREVLELLYSVKSALVDEEGKTLFAVCGQVALAGYANASDSGNSSNARSQINIRWDTGVGNQCLRASLPVARWRGRGRSTCLLGTCQLLRAGTFGRGSEDVYDESYRKAGKLDEGCFSTDFNPYEYGIIDVVSRSLAQRDIHYGVRAELYKLNVYSEPSGVFNLTLTPLPLPLRWGPWSFAFPTPTKLLECSRFLPNGGTLAFTCSHAYSHSSDASSPESLEHFHMGLDMVVFQALKRLTGSASVRGAIDTRERIEYYMEDDEADSPTPEDLYTTTYAIGETVEGPELKEKSKIMISLPT